MDKNDFLPVVSGDEENRRWKYIHPQTHRQFTIEEMDDGRLFVYEFRPNGRLFEETGTGSTQCWEEVGLKEIIEQSTPNTYWENAAQAGYDMNHAVFWGSGHGVYTRYFDSLDECAQAIEEAIHNNEWFSSEDTEKRNDPAFQVALRKQNEAMRREYQESKRAAIEEAERVNHGLFKGCCNMFGPLPKESQQQILAYLNRPSEEAWESIYPMQITMTHTLWRAWIEADPQAPLSKPLDGSWPSIPLPEVLRQAIRQAVESEKTD